MFGSGVEGIEGWFRELLLTNDYGNGMKWLGRISKVVDNNI